MWIGLDALAMQRAPPTVRKANSEGARQSPGGFSSNRNGIIDSRNMRSQLCVGQRPCQPKQNKTQHLPQTTHRRACEKCTLLRYSTCPTYLARGVSARGIRTTPLAIRHIQSRKRAHCAAERIQAFKRVVLSQAAPTSRDIGATRTRALLRRCWREV